MIMIITIIATVTAAVVGLAATTLYLDRAPRHPLKADTFASEIALEARRLRCLAEALGSRDIMGRAQDLERLAPLAMHTLRIDIAKHAAWTALPFRRRLEVAFNL